MTLVTVDLGRPEVDGVVPDDVRVGFQPTRRRLADTTIVLPKEFNTKLVDGSAVVELAPTGPDWVWKVTEYAGQAGIVRYVAVPDATYAGYWELVDVDPATLEPTAEPEAAWWAYAEGMAVDGAAAVEAAGVAVTAKNDALQATAEAEEARDQTVAVGTTNDAITAGNLASPTSLSRGVLNAAIEQAVSQLHATILTPTADINAWLATPSPQGVKRLLGTVILTAPLVVHSNTYFDATGATITHGGSVGMNMIQNAAVAATTTRDKNITIVGGTWDRLAYGGTGPNLHSSRYRRVDGLRITGQTWSAASGKYCVNVGDVTNFEIDHLEFLDTFSDGIHIQGPSSGGRVHHIRGITHDDTVAITGNDYAAYNDMYGNVTDVRIWDITARSNGANIVKVLAGKDCKVDDITVEGIRGSHGQHAVWLGDDNGEANTDNGTHGTITVSDVDTTGDAIASCQVYGNLDKGAREINLNNITLRSGLGQRAINLGVGATGIIDLLRVHRVKVDGLSARRAVGLRTAAGATVKRLEITSPTIRAVGGNCILLEAPSVTLGDVVLNDLNLTTDDTSSSSWIDIGDLSPVGSITVNGGRVQGGRCLIQVRSAASVTLTGGLTVDTVNRLVNLYKAGFTLTFGEVAVSNVINKLVFANTDVTSLTILGGGAARLPAAPDLIERPGTHPVRVNGSNLVADILILTPQNGDMVTVAVGKGAVVTGAKVLAQAGAWKDLYAGTVWP